MNMKAIGATVLALGALCGQGVVERKPLGEVLLLILSL